MPIKLYTNSLSATILSIVGSASMLGGIAMLFTGMIIYGIILIAVSLGAFFLAEKISSAKREKQVEKRQKKYLEDPKLPEKLRNSCLDSLEFVELFPTEEGLETVRKYNPYAASQIRRKMDNEITYSEMHLDFRLTDMANKSARKKGLSLFDGEIGSAGRIAQIEEKHEADSKKYKTNRIIKNALCIVSVLVFVLGWYIGLNFKPDKEFTKYDYSTAADTYTAVDIIAIEACNEDENLIEYECAFVTEDNYTGIISSSRGEYNSDAVKPIIEAMYNMDITPEPVRFYGNTTMDVSDTTRQWAADRGHDVDQFAPVRIRGSMTREKGVSVPGIATICAGVLLMLLAFVYACVVNLQKNRLKSLANVLEFERTQANI